MFNFQGMKKKFLSVTTAVAVGATLMLSTPSTVDAAKKGDLVGAGLGIIIGAAQANAQIDANIKHYNESETGRQELYQDFRKKYGVNEDPEYNALLEKVMGNLTTGVARIDPSIKDKPYLYFVAEQDTVNAACSMGHVMMVNAGTFKKITNEDEIAAIVAHELAHGQRDHVAKNNRKYLQKAVTASVVSAAIGSAVGNSTVTSLITNIALNQSVAHGDRKFETEADLVGFDYMIHTNYNPGACAAVMQKFVEMSSGAKKSAAMSFFNPSNHPDSDKRRDAYVKKLFEYSGKHVTAKDGVITINNKTFLKVAATAEMSSAERSYFVLGNLAAAYHNGQNKSEATVQDGIVMLGNQPIIAPVDGDESAQDIADKLNSIK